MPSKHFIFFQWGGRLCSYTMTQWPVQACEDESSGDGEDDELSCAVGGKSEGDGHPTHSPDVVAWSECRLGWYQVV